MKNSRIVLLILLVGFLALSLTTCAGSLGLNGVLVKPANPHLLVGGTQQFTATGYYNDQTIHDITTQVTWSSSDPSVATVDSSGLATALALGTTTITATSSEPSSFSSNSSLGSTILTVNAPPLSSIVVTPANPSIPVGVTQPFTATGTFSDGTSRDITAQVTWSSSNTSIATVNSSGLATAVAVGTGTTITATSGKISGSTTLTVNSATLSSISVTPANPSIPAGVPQQFTATGTYSDGMSYAITAQVTWSSSNISAATVDSSGLATAVAAGGAAITATSGSISGSASLTVNSATLSSISVAPANPSIPSIPVGITQQFTATGTYSDGVSYDITAQVTWSSSNTSVATVNSSGLAAGVAAGSTTITAASGNISGRTILTGTAATLSSISITIVNPSVTVGAIQP
ncbi:MAG: Ig-like domain-containing protein, partial [Deltaproteobacteria bacterium]|nr:Ig-like domain-containing protein [Deltaproteobacteria bacterium]